MEALPTGFSGAVVCAALPADPVGVVLQRVAYAGCTALPTETACAAVCTALLSGFPGAVLQRIVCTALLPQSSSAVVRTALPAQA